MSARFRVRWYINTFFILILVLGSWPYNHNVSAQELNEKTILAQRLNGFLERDPNLKGALLGISIRSSTNGKLLYQHNGDIRLKPASNMKLLTAVTALSKLGENFRFKTEVLTDGLRNGNTLKGNLYLKGNGDPTLLNGDFDSMARKIHQKGIKVITGDLIGDDTWYDDVRYSLDLPWSDEQTYYGAQISALTASPNKDYDAGTVIVEVVAGKEIGQSAQIKVTPRTGYIHVINQTVTVSPEGMKEITTERKHGTNTITVKGTIPIGAKKYRTWIAVWEPTGYAMDLFKQSLDEQGIKLMGTVISKQTPKKAHLLVSHKSMPLSELLTPFLKLSNNGHSEILVKEMGRVVKGEGSWEKGLEVLQSELEKFSVNPNTLVIRDGSGISHANLIPANEISNLLYSVQFQPWFQTFRESLPVSGDSHKMDGGTLRKRMKDPFLQGKVRAKTGTLSTVSSLSGYIDTKSGETLIFSILINNLLDESKGKGIEDEIVTILANM
ncbi:D-alanyl-D-alanine carboxypeptidase/D-alanyl-D-alanine endopeptidase [Bacillus sp. 1NLA3E]|uniref:D-alanyl-D-alanine carboxypeptidase/D-alanyl-D-alanine endopeptidase n=1 Tax=Bacillus sp. 1NLA3E TaxID=666686 RepID=UPI000247ED19|nr:D-alanyl-D-alanine carboxypeptidase/D-alanyl-D-alanine-endopeptidase [Bacillus sp. 1NLA3E]AGK54217.1 D-alanyl-D-alanine carboxypeptidase [Bacillus sp. 1NLA3E]